MSRSSLAALLLAVAALVSALPASAATTPTTTRLFMRADGDACPGEKYLGLKAGANEPRCGYQAGAPFREASLAGAPVAADATDFTTRSPFAATLDAARDVTGNVRVYSWSQTQRAAVGELRVDVAVVGVTLSGQTVTLGTASSKQTINPTNSAMVSFPFTIPVDDALAGTQLKSVTTTVDIRGAHLFSGYHQLNGESFVDLPTLVEDPAV